MRRRQNNSLKLVDKTIGKSKFESWEKEVAAWRQGFEKILLDSHTTAARMGRLRAGNFRNAPRKDEKLGRAALREERKYLKAFEKDLLDGKYGQGEDVNKSAIDNRMFMYLDKARATANNAFGENSKPDKWQRIMLAAEHCGTCPPKARFYETWADLKTAGLPADGSDECLTRCECIIVRDSDSRFGFGSVFEKVKPALGEDGKVPSDVYLPTQKTKFFVTKPPKVLNKKGKVVNKWADKSGLFGVGGFDASNMKALKEALIKHGQTYPLLEVEPSKHQRRFIAIGDIEGPDGKLVKNMMVRWSQDARRGLKLDTAYVPSQDIMEEYEAFRSSLGA
jgi:hypothetical protein